MNVEGREMVRELREKLGLQQLTMRDMLKMDETQASVVSLTEAMFNLMDRVSELEKYKREREGYEAEQRERNG